MKLLGHTVCWTLVLWYGETLIGFATAALIVLPMTFAIDNRLRERVTNANLPLGTKANFPS